MIKNLPDSRLDIIGDVHGEAAALDSLLRHLGYKDKGSHPQGRQLVFVGDLCDRGPNSPKVLDTVRSIVESGNGEAVLGNHELNLLRGDRKTGNDWFWDESAAGDQQFEPFQRLQGSHRNAVLKFLAALPVALVRDDLRIVHAAWHAPSLQRIADGHEQSIASLFVQWENSIKTDLAAEGLLAAAAREEGLWEHALNDPSHDIPLLAGIGRCDERRQMGNPLRVVTSGFERLVSKEPFFSGGKWRFAERVKWWDEYTDSVPVVVGHYWRRFAPIDRVKMGKGDPNLFAEIDPTHWHGKQRNVFCVDFSVGGRFHERRTGQTPGTTTKLAALRWPEKTLTLDTGEQIKTRGYNAS